MTRKIKTKQKSATHFERVPLEVVKKIAEVKAPKERKTWAANLFFEPASEKAEPYSMRAESLSRERL